ncbi:Pheromone-regulated membrane protein 10 [Leucoagaricus sp. SymC.cos]|nr:Pheromone-regulated membrane protein 10 [Leucoagaricus sp. SymC.cos]
MDRPSQNREAQSGREHQKTYSASSAGPTRTPRRIQWLDESNPENGVRRAQHSSLLTYFLLIQFLIKPEAFRQLIEGLERHRETREKTWSKVHYYTPRTPRSPCSGEASDDEDSINGSRPALDASTVPSHHWAPTKHSYPPRGIFDETPAQSPTHEVPDNYIDPYEDSGLPGTNDLNAYSRKRATKVVQSHLHGMRGPQATTKKRVTKMEDYFSPRDGSSAFSSQMEGRDVEEGLSAPKTYPSSQGGILSSLLQLYGEGGHLSYGSTSTLPSITSTRVGSPLEQEKVGPVKDQEEKRKKKYQKIKSRLSVHAFSSRPPQSRNAGGVIGSLIASTGNLAGVAAPIHSQLQPNVDRTGYRLSRYSLKQPVRPPPPARLPSFYGADPDRISQCESGKSTPSSPLYQEIRKLSSTMLDSLSYKSGDRRRGGALTPNQSQPSSDCEDWVHRRRFRSEGRKQKRHKAEVFITRHVARVIQREEFILKLTRAMMMFGGPSHRLQSQIQCAARVLDIDLCVIYFPDNFIISFDDDSTGTSHVKIIRQASALDLGKLSDAYHLYWKVTHDQMYVADASARLDDLMRQKPFYNWWQQILIGGMCSSAICTVSFGGSFVDALVAYPLGALLVAIQQLSVRHVLYANIFEFTVTCLFSFICAALAATRHFCYPAIASSSVVLILPGFLVLTGSLEVMSRKIVSGSTRILFAMMYALFLGFGFAMGAACFEKFTHTKVFGAEDYSCTMTHRPDGPWYQRTPSQFWAFLTVPLYSLFLSMKNQAPCNRRELPLLVIIASIGWVTNYFTGTRFVGQSDITAAVGAFAVGIVANIYARIFSGRNAFVVMITGILFQLPSGLGNDGLLSYASQQASGSTTSYISGFHTAMKLVSVAIGLTIGLGLASVIAHPRQSKRREDGIFSM